MELLLELLTLNERIYSKDGDLVISIQHSKEPSDKEAISTFLRRNPYQSHLPGDHQDVDVYSLLNYISSSETTKLLQSLKGKGPYTIKPKHFDTFMDEVVKNAAGILQKLRPDTVVVPKSSSSLVSDFATRLKSVYSKADYVNDAFLKRVLDAENIEPLINKEHPDWKKFEADHPKEAADLRKSLGRMIKTTGQLEIKKIYKPYAKFIKNFVQLEGASELIDMIIDKKVLIIDDILSSGLTMNEMIREVKELEAAKIFGLTIFKRTSAMKESAVVNSLVDEFIKHYQDRKNVSEDFGSGTFKEICEEPGNCAMVSEKLVQWLKRFDVNAKTLTGSHATNSTWAKNAKIRARSEEDAHTVVHVGDKIVDLTARQFDPKAKYPKIITLEQFKQEWEKVL